MSQFSNNKTGLQILLALKSRYKCWLYLFVNYTFILSCWVWKSNETCDAQENYKIKVLFRI